MLVVTLERGANGQDHSHTWIANEGFDSYEYRLNEASPWPLDPWKMYSVCFYWAMQTLTTIGYGDTANPTNENEFIVASLAMSKFSRVTHS